MRARGTSRRRAVECAGTHAELRAAHPCVMAFRGIQFTHPHFLYSAAAGDDLPAGCKRAVAAVVFNFKITCIMQGIARSAIRLTLVASVTFSIICMASASAADDI